MQKIPENYALYGHHVPAVCSYSLACTWDEVPATTTRIMLGVAIPTCDKCADFYDRMKS